MKAGVAFPIVAVAITVIYAVALGLIYRHLAIDAEILSLCALAAILTTLALAGLWRLLRGAKPS